MCAYECSLQNIEVNSLVLNLARNVAESEVNEIQVTNITSYDYLFYTYLYGLVGELLLERKLWFEHHVRRSEISMNRVT